MNIIDPGTNGSDNIVSIIGQELTGNLWLDNSNLGPIFVSFELVCVDTTYSPY